MAMAMAMTMMMMMTMTMTMTQQAFFRGVPHLIRLQRRGRLLPHLLRLQRRGRLLPHLTTLLRLPFSLPRRRILRASPPSALLRLQDAPFAFPLQVLETQNAEAVDAKAASSVTHGMHAVVRRFF